MEGLIVERLTKKSDHRGWLFEALRGDWLGPKKEFGQVHVSVALPGKVRGNHFHTRKAEWFFVTSGSAQLLLKNKTTGETKEIFLSEKDPKSICIPPGTIHAIKNIGPDQMVLIVYSYEPFDPNDPDTFFQKILD